MKDIHPSDFELPRAGLICITSLIIIWAMFSGDYLIVACSGVFLLIVLFYFDLYEKFIRSKFYENLPVIILVAIVAAVVLYMIYRQIAGV